VLAARPLYMILRIVGSSGGAVLLSARGWSSCSRLYVVLHNVHCRYSWLGQDQDLWSSTCEICQCLGQVWCRPDAAAGGRPLGAPWVDGQPLVLHAAGPLWPYCHVHVPANRHGNAHEVPACAGLHPNRQTCSVWRAHQQGTTGGSTVILPIGCGLT